MVSKDTLTGNVHLTCDSTWHQDESPTPQQFLHPDPLACQHHQMVSKRWLFLCSHLCSNCSSITLHVWFPLERFQKKSFPHFFIFFFDSPLFDYFDTGDRIHRRTVWTVWWFTTFLFSPGTRPETRFGYRLSVSEDKPNRSGLLLRFDPTEDIETKPKNFLYDESRHNFFYDESEEKKIFSGEEDSISNVRMDKGQGTFMTDTGVPTVGEVRVCSCCYKVMVLFKEMFGSRRHLKWCHHLSLCIHKTWSMSQDVVDVNKMDKGGQSQKHLFSKTSWVWILLTHTTVTRGVNNTDIKWTLLEGHPRRLTPWLL